MDDLARKLTRVCGVPVRFAGLDLGDMEDRGDDDYRESLNKIAKVGGHLYESRGLAEVFLFMSGAFGAGKTRAACWLLDRFYRGVRDQPEEEQMGFGGFPPFFISAKAMGKFRFSTLMDAPDDEAAVAEYQGRRERLFKSRFLVIDDANRLAGQKGEFEFLEEVVEERWNNLRSTVITTSSGPDEYPARFADFVKTFERVTFPVESFRTGPG